MRDKKFNHVLVIYSYLEPCYNNYVNKRFVFFSFSKELTFRIFSTSVLSIDDREFDPCKKKRLKRLLL